MRMIRIILIIIGIAAIVGISFAFFSDKDRNESQNFNKVPDFALQDYNGKTNKLADFAGKPLVINSWAAWCPFCRQELPDFVQVQKEFGDQVIIIAVDRTESLDTQKKYTDDLEVTNKLIFLQDPDDSFYRAIGGFSMPETIFVDRDGNIRDHKRGPMDANEIRERIKKIL